MKLMVVFGSSRAGRQGEVVANWVKSQVSADDRFEIDYVDLQELKLPFFDEASNPFDMASLDEYKNPESGAWAERVQAAEGFIFITPEYNRGIPGVLKNAIDTVGKPWIGKAAGIISYGGLSGGALATAQLRLIAVELGLFQTTDWIIFAYFKEAFDKHGQPQRADYYSGKIKKMLDNLLYLQSHFQR